MNTINARARYAHAHAITVRFDLDVDGSTYDVSATANDEEGYDAEIWNEAGDAVAAGEFAAMLGFASPASFVETMLDGFHLEGPASFDLFVRRAVAQ